MRRHLMEAAQAAAITNPIEKWKMAAVLAKGSKFMSLGLNEYSGVNSLPSTTAVPAEHTCGIHAETAALKPFQFKDTKGFDMYVARYRNDRKWGLALPCQTCYTHLLQKGIRRVYFTDGNGGIGRIKI